MPLAGIANENEFYSAYYLDSLLTKDLKDLTKNLQGDTEQTPDRLLAKLRSVYFRLRDRLAQIPTIGEKLELQQDFQHKVLEILGYDRQPQIKALADDYLLPIAVEVSRGNGTPLLWIVEGVNLRSEERRVGKEC